MIEAMRKAYDQRNFREARRLGERLSALRDPEGMTMVGRLYAEGRTGPPRFEDAKAHFFEQAQMRFREAGALGFAEATRRLGMLYFDPRWDRLDASTGWRYLEEAAAAGDMVAYFEQARLVLEGRRAPKDVKLALGLLNRAVDGGVADAMADLGYAYISGSIVPRDVPKGRDLVAKAVAAGSARGQFAMAMSMRTGYSRPQTVVAASEYNASTAAEYREAGLLLAEAAGKGEPRAMLALGLMLRDGEGTPIDLAGAYRWLRRLPRAVEFDPLLANSARLLADALAPELGPARTRAIDAEIEAASISGQ